MDYIAWRLWAWVAGIVIPALLLAAIPDSVELFGNMLGLPQYIRFKD